MLKLLRLVRAAAYASDSGESLHCFPVGARIGSKRVIHQPGDSVEELSGGTGTV